MSERPVVVRQIHKGCGGFIAVAKDIKTGQLQAVCIRCGSIWSMQVLESGMGFRQPVLRTVIDFNTGIIESADPRDGISDWDDVPMPRSACGKDCDPKEERDV